MAPNISVREYIRWLPDEPQEPTTTLVLTSAENSFIDIRILKPWKDDPPDEVTANVLHTTRLDWAFGGHSSSKIHQSPNGKHVLHSTWHHWVDSRTGHPETVVDEGDMFPQSDGTTLERGSMVNPRTGLMTDYEECWRDVEAASTSDDAENERKCVVLRLHDDAHQARGMVIRVGQFCQGVMRVGDYVSLERWEWKNEGGWKRTARIGDMWLPCGVVLDGERLRLGGEVRYGEYVWKAVEMSTF